MALISIIIPCYNVSPFLNRCLTSIENQTLGMEALEIICIDDASTDNTLSILEAWEKKYPNQFLLIPFPQNARQGTARNVGLQYASAPWISYVDSDDWLEPDFFEKLYNHTNDSAVEMVMCRHERDFHKDLTLFERHESAFPNHYLYIDTLSKRRNYIRATGMEPAVWGKLIRRSFLDKHNLCFPEGLAYEDNYWTTLMHCYLNCAYVIEEPLYHYFVNDHSTILQINAPHHADYLRVYENTWEMLKQRGVWEIYYYEFMFDALHTCYLGFLKIVCLRYSPPSYELFLQLKDTIHKYFPDYDNCPYLSQGFNEFQKLLIQMLSLPIDSAQFSEVASKVTQLGI